jgi:hypothetical protein
MSTAEGALRALFDCTTVVLGRHPDVFPEHELLPEHNDMILIHTIPNAAPEYHRDMVSKAETFVAKYWKEVSRIDDMVPRSAPAEVRKTSRLTSPKTLLQKCRSVVCGRASS